ncbi:biopolymer transporter ExbD [bacterium]|nr:biopolymer transporter ExbD [bacterium]
MDIAKRKKISVQLNITPLIDIVFLLLIFFMLTSTFIKEEAIDLALPEAESGTRREEEEVLRIAALGEDRYRVHGEELSSEELGEKLQGYDSAKAATLPVLVVMDHGADVQLLVSTMDLLQTSGFSHVSLATENTPDLAK